MRQISIDSTPFTDCVMSPVVYMALNPVRRTALASHEPIKFTIDCGFVTLFTSEALAVLAKARRELGYQGHQLVLTNYSSEIAHDMIVPLFYELLEGWHRDANQIEAVSHRPRVQRRAA